MRDFDPRDVSDSRRFASDLCDIGVITRADRQRIVIETAELLPQALSQALVSFLVNMRDQEIAPAGRAGYVVSSAKIQDQRLRELAE